MKSTAILAMSLSMVLTGPAYAGFAYTEWGMSPSDVVTASRGEAVIDANPETAPNGFVASVRGSYASGTRHFDARFYFAKGKLSQVLLTQTQGDCGTLLQELYGTYGTPSKLGSVLSITEWNDPKKGNIVHFLMVDGVCKVGYTPLTNYSPNRL